MEQSARSADEQRHAGDFHQLYFPGLYECGNVPVGGPVPDLNAEGMNWGDHSGRMSADRAGEPIMSHNIDVADDLPDLEDQSVASADLEVEVLQPEEELAPVVEPVAPGLQLAMVEQPAEWEAVPDADADAAEALGGLNVELLLQQGIEPNPGPMGDGLTDASKSEARGEEQRPALLQAQQQAQLRRTLNASHELMSQSAILRLSISPLLQANATPSQPRTNAEAIKELHCGCDSCHAARVYSVGVRFPDLEDLMASRTPDLLQQAFNLDAWRNVLRPMELAPAITLSEARYWVQHGLLLAESGRLVDTRDQTLHVLRQRLA